MDDLLPVAARVADELKRRDDRIAVAESSAGGLIAAALLAQPGASAYFLAGSVVYTKEARAAVGIGDTQMAGLRSSSEPYALLLAQTVCSRVGADWGLAETGAAGPSGNRYGDPAGHTCIAVAGAREVQLTYRTGSDDRVANMHAFALKALETLADMLGQD